MSNRVADIWRDSRGRIVLGTMAKDEHDDRLHFACYFCDGDFLSNTTFEAHVMNSHFMTTIEPQPAIKMETPVVVGEIVEIMPHEEIDTISISSDEPEEDRPSTAASAQNQEKVTSNQMRMPNGANPSGLSFVVCIENGASASGPSVPSVAVQCNDQMSQSTATKNNDRSEVGADQVPKTNTTNGEINNNSQTNEPQPSTSKENNAESTGNKQVSNETLTNGKNPSDPQPQPQQQQTEQSKSSASKENDQSSDESDDDISSISSLETKKSTLSNRSSNGHRPEHNRNGNNQSTDDNFQCSYCPEAFKGFHQFRMHQLSCVPWKNALFPCTVAGCSKKYRHRASRDDHIFKKHQNEFPIPCQICPRRFETVKKKYEHQKRMHSNNEILKCHFCKLKFFSNYQRNNHVKDYHKEGEYECPVCDRSFKQEDLMRAHKKEAHPIQMKK